MEQYLYRTYLIGAMEKTAEHDDGSEKRLSVEKELLLRNVYPINPVRLEATKTGMTAEEIKEKMIGWISGGCWELFNKKANEIWQGIDKIDFKIGMIHIPGDIEYCLMSNWITFTFNKGDVCCLSQDSLILMEDFTYKKIKI